MDKHSVSVPAIGANMLTNTMTNLDERIQLIMDEKNWDIATVARVAGVTHSAVSQWLGRGSKPTKSIGDMEAAQKLSVATGYKALWIAKGKGDKKQTYPKSGTISDDPGAGFESLLDFPLRTEDPEPLPKMSMPAPTDKTDLILLNVRLLLSALPADKIDAAGSALVAALVPFLRDKSIQ